MFYFILIAWFACFLGGSWFLKSYKYGLSVQYIICRDVIKSGSLIFLSKVLPLVHGKIEIKKLGNIIYVSAKIVLLCCFLMIMEANVILARVNRSVNHSMEPYSNKGSEFVEWNLLSSNLTSITNECRRLTF